MFQSVVPPCDAEKFLGGVGVSENKAFTGVFRGIKRFLSSEVFGGGRNRTWIRQFAHVF